MSSAKVAAALIAGTRTGQPKERAAALLLLENTTLVEHPSFKKLLVPLASAPHPMITINWEEALAAADSAAFADAPADAFVLRAAACVALGRPIKWARVDQTRREAIERAAESA